MQKSFITLKNLGEHLPKLRGKRLRERRVTNGIQMDTVYTTRANDRRGIKELRSAFVRNRPILRRQLMRTLN